MTSAEDIGSLTARIALDDPNSISSGVIYIAGDTTTFGQVAEELKDRGWRV